ncbi:unnamed protein product [Lampetra planeri]
MLLLLLLPSLAAAVALLAGRGSHAAAPRSCPAPCTCAGEVVDCSGRAIASLRPGSVSLPRYASVLDLSHNLLQKLQPGWLSGSAALSRLSVAHCRLNFIAQGAFSAMGHLQHLDLSSNRLGSLEADTLEGLPALEVLLLYNNSISRLHAAAFAPSPLLRAVYLSHNALLRVPADTLASMPRLSLFDVSFNRVASVPVQELNSLPAPLRDGLLLHGNPLECECQLYLLLASWRRRRFRSVTEFADGEMRCARRPNGTAPATAAVDLLRARPEELGCSQTGGDVFRASYRAHLTDVLTVPCDVLVVGQSGTEYEWLTPSRTLDSVRILPGGALEIRALEPDKLSGEYTCRAWNARLRINDSVTVNVTVLDTPPPESFSTGLTTLIACSATLLMVLLYLYLTPCGCRRHAQHRRREHAQPRPRCCCSCCSYCCYSCYSCLRCCGHNDDDAAAAGCYGPCSHGGGGGDGGEGGGDCCQFGHSMHAGGSGGGGALAGGGRMPSHAAKSRAPGHSALLGPGSSWPGTGAKHVAFREPAAASSHNGSAGAARLVRTKPDSESASSEHSDAASAARDS